ARLLDVDGGKDALVHEAAVQVHLHVTGALELLEDDVVHPGTRVDEGGGHDGERAAFLDIAGGREETPWPLQRIGVETSGQHLARRGNDRVVGAGNAGDGVEEDHHVTLVLHQSLGLIDDHVVYLDVA